MLPQQKHAYTAVTYLKVHNVRPRMYFQWQVPYRLE